MNTLQTHTQLLHLGKQVGFSMSARSFSDPHKMILEYQSGDSVGDIATRYGVSKSSVSRELKRNGIPMRGLSEASKLAIKLKGNPNTGKKFSEERKLKLRGPRPSIMGEKNPNYGKGLFGDKNGNWNGGISSELGVDRYYREYRLWKSQVKQRDDGKCVLCEARKNIVCHHIIPYNEDKEMRFEVSNGVVLCKKCHSKVHQRMSLYTSFLQNLVQRGDL